MKLKIEKKELEKLVGVTGKATAGQTTKQILKAVLLETTGNGLRATGNDLSIGIRKYVDAEIEEAGRIAVDAKMLGDIVKKTARGCGESTDRFWSIKNIQQENQIPTASHG